LPGDLPVEEASLSNDLDLERGRWKSNGLPGDLSSGEAGLFNDRDSNERCITRFSLYFLCQDFAGHFDQETAPLSGANKIAAQSGNWPQAMQSLLACITLTQSIRHRHPFCQDLLDNVDKYRLFYYLML
jgi:hypothetical protein